MRIKVGEIAHEGTALDCLEFLRKKAFDADRFKTPDEYIAHLRTMLKNATGKEPIPFVGWTLEERAEQAIKALARAGMLEINE